LGHNVEDESLTGRGRGRVRLPGRLCFGIVTTARHPVAHSSPNPCQVLSRGGCRGGPERAPPPTPGRGKPGRFTGSGAGWSTGPCFTPASIPRGSNPRGSNPRGIQGLQANGKGGKSLAGGVQPAIWTAQPSAASGPTSWTTIPPPSPLLNPFIRIDAWG